MSDSNAPAPAPEPAPAPASPTFASLFSQILKKLEGDIPSIAGLEALWAAHQARGHSYDEERAKLAQMHDALSNPAPKPSAKSDPEPAPKIPGPVPGATKA